MAAPAGIPAALVAPGARFRQVSVAVAAGFMAGSGSVAVLPWHFVPGLVGAFGRSRCVPCTAGIAFHTVPDPERRLMRSLQGHAIERRDAFAGGPLELIGKLPGVVGDQLRAVPGPADFHVERSSGSSACDGALASIADDHVVDRAPLERMHGGVVEKVHCL